MREFHIGREAREGVLSRSIALNTGLGQGCCVAPTLFNIFLAAVSGNGCMVDGRLDWPCRIDGILRLHLDPGTLAKYTT